LYEQRDKIGKGEYLESYADLSSQIKTTVGLNDSAIDSILKEFKMGKTGDAYETI